MQILPQNEVLILHNQKQKLPYAIMVPSTLNFFLEKSNFSPHHFENIIYWNVKKVYVVSCYFNELL